MLSDNQLQKIDSLNRFGARGTRLRGLRYYKVVDGQRRDTLMRRPGYLDLIHGAGVRSRACTHVDLVSDIFSVRKVQCVRHEEKLIAVEDAVDEDGGSYRGLETVNDANAFLAPLLILPDSSIRAIFYCNSVEEIGLLRQRLDPNMIGDDLEDFAWQWLTRLRFASRHHRWESREGELDGKVPMARETAISRVAEDMEGFAPLPYMFLGAGSMRG